MPDVATGSDTHDDGDLPKARGAGAPEINDSAEARRRRELPDNDPDPEANRGSSLEINENTVGDND